MSMALPDQFRELLKYRCHVDAVFCVRERHTIRQIQQGMVFIPDDPHAVRMKISILENTGREAAVFLTGADIPDITMVTGADFSGRAGQEVYIRLKPEKILLFNTETGCAYGDVYV